MGSTQAWRDALGCSIRVPMDAANCPWELMTPASISFCEARLCGWVAEPSNAWSNAAYLLPAWWVLTQQRVLPVAFQRLAAIAAIALAATSFFFHASASRIGELADVSSMYVLPAMSLGRAFSERGLIRFGLALPFLTWAGATAAMYFTGSDGIIVWGSLAMTALAVSAVRLRRLPDRRYAQALGVIGSFLIGYAIWWTDKLGWLCNPNGHLITGHAVWHCFTALSVVFFFKLEVRLTEHPAALQNVRAGEGSAA